MTNSPSHRAITPRRALDVLEDAVSRVGAQDGLLDNSGTMNCSATYNNALALLRHHQTELAALLPQYACAVVTRDLWDRIGKALKARRSVGYIGCYEAPTKRNGYTDSNGGAARGVRDDD